MPNSTKEREAHSPGQAKKTRCNMGQTKQQKVAVCSHVNLKNLPQLNQYLCPIGKMQKCLDTSKKKEKQIIMI